MSGRTVVHIGKSPAWAQVLAFMFHMLIQQTAVLFKFKPDVSVSHREAFARELRTLRKLPSVLDGRLIVGGPSITDPIERSKGCHFALLSFHKDRNALAAYQASAEHER